MTKPLIDEKYYSIADDIITAQKNGMQKNLALILKSKTAQEVFVVLADMVDIFSETGIGKRGVWSEPKLVLFVNREAPIVTIPRKM